MNESGFAVAAPAPSTSTRTSPPVRFPKHTHFTATGSFTKQDVRRLARRGGTKRMSSTVHQETHGVLKVFLEKVLKEALIYTEHARRKTVSVEDVLLALRRKGHTLLR